LFSIFLYLPENEALYFSIFLTYSGFHNLLMWEFIEIQQGNNFFLIFILYAFFFYFFSHLYVYFILFILS
jgi:hypothetical protein